MFCWCIISFYSIFVIRFCFRAIIVMCYLFYLALCTQCWYLLQIPTGFCSYTMIPHNGIEIIGDQCMKYGHLGNVFIDNRINKSTEWHVCNQTDLLVQGCRFPGMELIVLCKRLNNAWKYGPRGRVVGCLCESYGDHDCVVLWLASNILLVTKLVLMSI